MPVHYHFHRRLVALMLHRYGVPGSLLVYVLVAVLASILLTAGITFWLWETVSRNALVIAGIISAVVSTPLSYLHLSLISEIEQAQAATRDLAITDGLTGVYNRRYLMERAEQAVAHALDHLAPLSIILFDVDDFKSINDSFGHQLGDTMLQNISQKASEVMRPADLFARFGGEEFIALLPNTDIHAARALAEQIRQKVAASTVLYKNRSVQATISLGVICAPEMPFTLDEMLAHVDHGLYQAKRFGKNCVWVVDWNSPATLFAPQLDNHLDASFSAIIR